MLEGAVETRLTLSSRPWFLVKLSSFAGRCNQVLVNFCRQVAFPDSAGVSVAWKLVKVLTVRPISTEFEWTQNFTLEAVFGVPNCRLASGFKAPNLESAALLALTVGFELFPRCYCVPRQSLWNGPKKIESNLSKGARMLSGKFSMTCSARFSNVVAELNDPRRQSNFQNSYSGFAVSKSLSVNPGFSSRFK